MQNVQNPGELKSFASAHIEAVIDEKECSRITGRSVGSLRRDRVMNQGIRYVKYGSLVRYRPFDIRAFLENNLRGGQN